MLTIEERTVLAIRWFRYFESLVYVECLAHNVKPPRLELKPDAGSYQRPGLIHIGYGMLEAESSQEFFDQLFHLLGHEMQHLFSSTDKDWEAAHKLCFRNACQRLSVKVFGRTRRLSKESDYDQFFKELAANGVFVNQKMLMDYANWVLNVLEDGRIENIRTRLHPGFGKYRKVFRGRRWIADDFRKEEFFTEDPSALDTLGKLSMILGQIYPLATLGIYQYGFLAAYGGTDAHKLCASFIPEISAAVVARTCKECMDQGRSIFDRLLDMVLDVCTIEADAKALEAFLSKLIEKLLEDVEKTKMSASPSTEEKGDGLPADSPLGHSELELEVDKETYEKLKEEAEEAGDDSMPGVRLKCKDAEDEAEEEADNRDSSGKGDPSADSDELSDSSGKGDASDDSSDGAAAGNKSKDPSIESEDGEPSGSVSADEGSDGGTEKSSEKNTENTSKGHDNTVDSSEGNSLTEDELAAKLEAAMDAAAAAPTADFNLAEADAKLDEEFKEAAARFDPVSPAPVPMGDIDARYAGYVRFKESTRKYTPTGRLPMELENKGKSLDRKIDQLIKNKQEPDLRFLRSGMLDTRRIANLAMGDIDVFRKKGEPVKSDVAGFLLMDNSGSMGNGPGSTRFACCNAFAVLEEGFKNHMPLKIAAFDADGPDAVMHEIIKEFDEVAPANLSYNFRDLGRGGWGNKDGYSIRVAAKQLQQRPEKDKILIVASDGFPTDYRGGSAEGIADVKSAVQEARKAGIRVIGLYMYHRQNDEDFAVYQDMYGRDIIFASLDEIEDELTRILQKYFR